MKAFFIVSLALILALPVASKTNAIVVVEDHFDDGVLAPSWSISLDNASGWTYEESGTNVTVTELDPTIINPGSGGTWSRVSLTRTFTLLSDFTVEANIAWDSEENLSAVQALFIGFRDSVNNVISHVGYFDAQRNGTGRNRVSIGDLGNVTDVSHDNLTYYHFLPLSGSASIRVVRNGETIDFFWDGTLFLSSSETSMLSTFETAPIGGISVEFWHYGCELGCSFGSESVDFVRVDGTPLSQPSPVEIDLDLRTFKIRKNKLTGRTVLRLKGLPDLPHLDVGDGDEVQAEITVKLIDVFQDGGDLVIKDERILRVRETEDVFVIRK